MSARILLVFCITFAVGVAADQGPISEITPASNPDEVPKGVVVMTSIQDILLQPSGSPIIGNPVAVGNNVLTSKSNVGNSKLDTSDSELVKATEDRLMNAEATTDDASLINELLVMFAGSDKALQEAIRPRVRALLPLRSDPIRLHSTIVAIITIVRRSQQPAPMNPSIPNNSSNLAASTSANEVFFGFRELFRYSWLNTFRFGWRYPINYWNAYGPSLYPGGCGFGQVFGPYFYC